MGRTLGVNDILKKEYKTLPIPEKWVKAIGQVSDPFRWLVFGNRKNGKTTLVMEFCKDISKLYKTYYNSSEEGDSLTIQEAMILTGFGPDNVGKFLLGDRDTFKQMDKKLEKNRAKIVVIDSRDYVKMTTEQWKYLEEKYGKKSFIIVCWENRGRPKGKYAEDMEYMVDMVTHVSDHIAITNGRFGSQLKYDIWPDKPTRKRKIGGLFAGQES